MKTTEKLVRDLLLSGIHLDKTIMRKHSEINSDCLAQRIKDIRYKTDWDIKWRSVPGKGTLREYWLEPQEIERIKSGKKRNEQLVEENQNLAEKASESLKSEDNAYFNEQLGIGLLGGHNY